MDTTEVVHRAIWGNIPELRNALFEFERKHVKEYLEDGLDPFISPYMLITDVLVYPYLIPLVDDPDGSSSSLQHCANAIERILDPKDAYLNDSERSSLCDLIGIRVVSHLLRKPERWLKIREYAGPLLKDYVREDSQYYIWPYDEPVV